MFEFIHNRFFLFLLGVINIVAGFYSLSFYAPQLSSSSIFLWPFIADCPFAAILFGAVLLMLSAGIKVRWLSFLAIMANVKFASWTIFVLAASGYMFSLWWILLVHLGLLIEVVVFFGLFDFRVKDVLLAIVLFSIGDYFDYVVGTHPIIPSNVFFFAGMFAILSTILFSFALPLIFSSKGGSFESVGSKHGFARKKSKWGI